MRPRFDSRPLVSRRRFTGQMRHTVVVEWPTQARHGIHLFCVIAASVTARNVANQELLDAVGPGVLGKLYVSVALITGLMLVAIGWLGREHDTRRIACIVHAAVAGLMVVAFLVPRSSGLVEVAKYVAMELSFAALLLMFGLMLGSSLGPREARKIAARVGVGGILGGMSAGALLGVGALLVGSRLLFLAAAAFALAPVFWLPSTQSVTARRRTTVRIHLSRERSDVPALAPYGRWLALTTMLMVAATTMIDYLFRFFAASRYDADEMTAFFGYVVVLAGCVTVVFQLIVLDRLLDRMGLFATASAMPGALMLCLGAFGLAPSLGTLVLLKLVDSGSNMSLQQATSGLLLAPLGPRARAVWQSRIDGLAKRGGQAITGLFLTAFPWAPARVLPVAVLLCALWLAALVVTRVRYVRLLTEMLQSAKPSKEEELGALEMFDAAALKQLEAELSSAAPPRAAVILELLEQADHRAPAHLLKRLCEADPQGPGALRVVQHLANLGDTEGLDGFTRSPYPQLAAESLMAMADLSLRLARERSRQILTEREAAEQTRACAAGILADEDEEALLGCQQAARSSDRVTRFAVVRAVGRTSADSSDAVTRLLITLAEDPDPEIGRTALAALGTRPSEASVDAVVRALDRRELRGAAGRALGSMGLPVINRVAEELGKRLADPHVATVLTRALGRIPSEATVAALVKALEAPIAQVRLVAAVALSTIQRRRTDISMPHEALCARYLPEIGFYARMRESSRSACPDTPVSRLLLRTLRQRAQASLETLFRLMALHYGDESMQGAFQGLTSGDLRQRQIALELLDTLLAPTVRNALTEAVGGVRATGRPRRQSELPLVVLAKDPDPFLASLARAVLAHGGGEAAARLRRTVDTGDAMDLTRVDQILELQSLQIFSQSSAEDLAEVAALVVPRRVSRGTVLFREGEPADAIYVVRTGELTLSRNNKPIDQVGPGDACGIVAVLDQLPRQLTATTTADCSLLVVGADDLLQLLADRPLLMHAVFRALTSTIRSHIDRVALGRRTEDEWTW